MRPIQPLVRLPHSHIDPNWLSTVERASRTPPREFYGWAADHILTVTGSLPGSRLVFTNMLASLATKTGYFGRVPPKPVTGLPTQVVNVKDEVLVGGRDAWGPV
jgi:hypothetical protein